MAKKEKEKMPVAAEMPRMKPDIRLEGDDIPDASVSVGDVVTLSLKVKVRSISEEEYDGKKTRCIRYELTGDVDQDAEEKKEKSEIGKKLQSKKGF